MTDCPPIIFPVANITEYVLSAAGERCSSATIVVPTVVIYFMIFVLGLVGNICTCVVIAANKSMHNPTNYYLFSLAISDILVLIIGLPMELYFVLDYAYPYMFGEAICKMRAFLIEFTSYASILTICAFSVERWLAICFPLRLKLFSTCSRAIFMIVASWVVSFVAALPIAFIVKINKFPLPDYAINQTWTHLVSADGLNVDKTEFCAMDIHNLDQQKNIIFFAFIAFFMLPACVMTIMYGHIAMRLRSADEYLSKDHQNQNSEKRSRSTRTVLKMLVSVVVSFFLCWLPFHLQRLLSIKMSVQEGNVSPAVQFVFTLVYYISGYCYYSNSACNPILYNILSEKYRKAFCRTILGNNLTKKIFPKWGDKKNGIQCRSNMEQSSHTHKGSVSIAKPLLDTYTKVRTGSEPNLKTVLV